jgi:hypothetical protein
VSGGDVARHLDDTINLTVLADQGVIRGLDPDLPAALADPLEQFTLELALDKPITARKFSFAVMTVPSG